MLIKLMMENPIIAVILAIALVVSLTVHEFAHALVADKLGDPTPRSFGRVSLNPLAHLDPIGTFLLVIAGFGWGKPVPIGTNYLRNPKRDNALIALAGPLSNFVFAVLLTVLSHYVTPIVALSLQFMALINLNLCFFNLLPLFPLDGEKVVAGLLPLNLHFQWEQIQKYGVYILMLLVVTRKISYLVDPLITISMKFLNIF
jgi:Zn-dependent protease